VVLSLNKYLFGKKLTLYQTYYNVNVDVTAAETLHSVNNPDRLFSNVHPILVFNKVI